MEERKNGNGLHQLPAPRTHPAPIHNAYPPQLPQGEAMDCGNGNQAVYGVLGP